MQCLNTSQFVEVTEESKIAIFDVVVIVVSIFLAASLLPCFVPAVIAIVAVFGLIVLTFFSCDRGRYRSVIYSRRKSVCRIELMRRFNLLVYFSVLIVADKINRINSGLEYPTLSDLPQTPRRFS